jgi:hypothetical protein
VAQALARAELTGLRPMGVRELARGAKLPEHELVPLLRRFARANLIHLARGRVALARDPRSLRLDELRALFRPGHPGVLPEGVAELAHALEDGPQVVSWADLADLGLPPPAPASLDADRAGQAGVVRKP